MSTSTLGLFLRHLALSEEVSRLGTASDHDLLTAYEPGRGQAAFTELMRRHGPMVLRTCHRILGQEPDAEDAFQATFVLLARKAGQLRREVTGPLSLGGWLHRVAYRTSLKALTGKVRRKVRERQAPAMPHPDPDPSAKATWNEIRPILDAELDALPDEARRLLIACYLQEKTYTEAAAELGLPRGSMAWRLEKARALLAERLARRGITVSASLLAVVLVEAAKGAGVPAVLLVHTVEAARTFTEQATGIVSDHVARLMKGGLAQMTKGWTHLGMALTGWLSLLGVGLIACQTLKAWPDRPPEGEPPATLAERPVREGDKQARTDLYGDPLPQGALARLGTTRLRHRCVINGVISVAFAPDGKSVASVGREDGVCLWEVATGKAIRTLPGHKAEVSSVAFALDGKTVAMGEYDGVVHLWEMATGKLIQTLKGHKTIIRKGHKTIITVMALSPDGKTVALTENWDNKTMRLREVNTGKEICSLQSKGEVRSAAFSPDGKTLAMGFVTDSEESKTLYGPKAQDGWEGMHLWQVATGKLIRTLQVRTPRNRSLDSLVAFSPDGKTVASAGTDRIVRLWEAATGKCIGQLGGLKGGEIVLCLAFSPDSQVLATSNSGEGEKVRLWEVATGKEIRILQGYKQAVWGIAFSPDSKTLATGSRDGIVRLWEAATGKEIQTPQGHEQRVFAVAFAPNGKTMATGGYDGKVRLWEAATSKPIRTLKGHKNAVFMVAFSPDGETVASGGADGTVRLWEVATGKEIHTLEGPKIRTLQGLREGSIRSVTFSPDGKTVASGGCDDGAVRLWEVATGKEMRTLRRQQEGAVHAVAFSPDGKTVALGDDKETVRLLETATGKEIRTLRDKEETTVVLRPPVKSVAFSPDGRTVASGQANGKVRLWEAASGKEIRTLQEGVKDYSASSSVEVAFSRDGRTLAVGSRNCVQLWDLLSGTALTSLAGHRGEVHGVIFSPDARSLVSVSEDTTGLVWDLTYGTARSATKLGPNTLRALWDDLANKDADRAGRAVWTLVATPVQSVPLLRDHLRPVPADTGRRLARLIADLDADEFPVREKAYRALEEWGPDVEPALRKGLEGRPSVELRKRLKQLLEAVGVQNRRGFSREVLRGLRAVEVLEQIGTPEARQVLQTLAAGAPGFLTQEAEAALARLVKRSAAKP